MLVLPPVWACCGLALNIHEKPLLMGIVNVTPDSFSDGGRYLDASHAVDHALQLIADGADILDIGGESTRPGATPVSADQEWARVGPVITALAKQTKTPISIDTMKHGVAKAAIDAGAVIMNDVAGLRDPGMIALAAATGAGVIINHMAGTPQTMQDSPAYTDVVAEVDAFFTERIKTLTDAGVGERSICLDPGIGFGKSFDHTIAQLKHLAVHQRHRLPVCLGVSRKGFLGQITGRPRPERDGASVAVALEAMAASAVQVLRVHNVAMHRDAVAIHAAIRHHAP
jgi:dihydropteroate synthase